MKQIFKHPRRLVTGLAAVGIAPALATVAQADTEPFPAELTQLIAEAKALNIQVVEGPNKTFGTNVDLQTYYDSLVHKLQDLVIQAKTTKATNENAQKAYQEAQAKYEKDLATYQAKQKEYEAQKTQFSQESDQYKKLQADYQKQLAEYQQKLDAWKQQSKADADAQTKYQADLAQYEKLKQEDAKAQAEYEKKKADYEKASTQASEDTSHYNEAKKEYAKAMADYQAKLAQYKTDLADYETKKAQYDKDLAEYNKAVAGSSTSDSEYAKKLTEYETAKKKYDADLVAYNQAQSKYQSDLATYKTQKAQYDSAMAQMEATKNQAGHLSQAAAQSLVYRSEPTARATGSDLVNAQPITRAGLQRAFDRVGLDRYYIDELVNNKDAFNIAVSSTGSTQESMSTNGKQGLGAGQDSITAYRIGRNGSLTIDYTNLKNSSYNGEPLSKVSMTVSIDPSSQNISDSGIVAFTQDPKLGFNVQFRRGDDNNKRYMLKFNVTMKFYDSKGNLINLTDENNALLGMSSFNSHQEPIGIVEGFVPGPGTSVIGITGSSIQNQGGRYYSNKLENTQGQFGQDNIDSTNNPYFWYLGSVLKMTGTSPTFQVFSGDPTQFGRPEPDRTYIPGLWMTATSELATTVAIKPTEPKAPVKPTEPVKPTKSPTTVPNKPVEPKKPVAPEKPSITPPVTPNTPPTTPPTPPTPKAGEKPKEPTPKAGEKPKEPESPNRPQPKDPADPATTPPVKPEAPKVTPTQIPPFTVQKGSVTELKTTRWITVTGAILKAPVVAPDFKPKDTFPGYEFVETKVDGSITTHIYRPIEKPVKKVTTIWVTVTGEVLKPRTDGEKPKENFDGYEFVRTDKDKDGNTTHIYRPVEKPVKKVTTIWVTEKGQVLKPRTDGEHPKENFDGYEFVRTDKDKDGNTTHIYRPIEKPTKKVTTIWVTEKGQVLKPRTDGEHPKENFDGYEFVRTDKDKDGNTTHIYRPIEKPVKKVTTIWVTEKGEVLKPRTDGEQPKVDFDGYEFVRTDKDKDGNTTHIYRKIEKPVKKVTTIWVTEKGQVLKPRTDGEHPKENFDGYEFVRTDKDKDGNISHIYKPVKKVTTIWVTEKGEVLKPRTDGEQPKENFDGYEFVRTDKDKDGNTTHIYRKVEKSVKKVTTIWVTEKGEVLKPRADGEQPKVDFDGYEFVRTDKDKDGNISHIYRKVEKPVKKVTTIWVTEKGEVLKPRTDGEQPKVDFDGYEFVRTDKDKDGNISHIYRKVEKPKVERKDDKLVYTPQTAKELPKTGDAGALFSFFGALFAGGGLAGIKRRKNRK